MSTRLRLRRADGLIYLDRWGCECRWFGVFLHKMEAPDPGLDLHDHPWWFSSLIVRGGYCEVRAQGRRPNVMFGRQRRRLKSLRLDECHRINQLLRVPTWTLVLHGPKRWEWGFYVDGEWIPWKVYEETVRAERRDMWAEISNVDEERINVPDEAA